MANSNPVRFLSEGSDDLALALEMYWGTVLENFHANTHLVNAVMPAGGEGNIQFDSNVVEVKTIEHGKSWQFITFADVPDPEGHTPGTELLGQNYAFGESNVQIDGILVKHDDVPLDQIQHSHFDPVTKLGNAHGRKLGEIVDKRGFSIAVQAALGAAESKNGLTLHNGGNVVERVDGSGVDSAYPVSATGAKNFRDDVDQLAEIMDTDNVPESQRFLVYTPRIRRVLQQDLTVFDDRYGPDEQNSFPDRRIGRMSSFNILPPTNHTPDSNITSTSLGGDATHPLPAKYQHDFTYDGGDDGQPVAIALCGADEGRSPLAFLAASHPRLGPIYSFMEVDERRNTVFLKSQMMIGWGEKFRPSAGAIIVDDS